MPVYVFCVTHADDVASGQGDKNKKSKDKKEAFVIKYEEDVDFDAKFKQTRAATMLTKATLDRYSKTQTTLPEDLHYDSDKLLKPFLKPKVMVSTKDIHVQDVCRGINNMSYRYLEYSFCHLNVVY